MNTGGSTRERGFSLIEVLVATAILVTGICSLLQLFMLSAASTTAAGHTTQSAILAAQKVEEIRSEPWGLAASGQDRVGAYGRRWTVESFPRDLDGTVIVHVVVDRAGTGGRVAVVTLKTRTGP